MNGAVSVDVQPLGPLGLLGSLCRTAIFYAWSGLHLLAIIGVTSTIAIVPVSPAFLRFDVWVMLACATGVTLAVLRRATIGRRAGAAMLAAYVAYLVVLYRPA